MERCGPSYGLHQVAYDTLSEVGFGLDYWWSRMKPAFPHLCVAPWGANAVRNTWGPCVSLEAFTERCQKWFHFACAIRPPRGAWTQPRAPMSQRELMEYERELYPHLCASENGLVLK